MRTHRAEKLRDRRKKLRCAVCPPNKGCNSNGKWRKHGTKKPRYKTQRKGR